MSLSKSDEHVRQIPVRPEHVENTQFPDGLRVLAIDDNEVCLRWLQALLEKCRYKVTASTNTIEALAMLRQNKDNFDIVITNVNKFDMDGFLLLDIIGLEMDIPVIMISADDSKSTVMKGIRHGARDYLLKPVRLEEIKNIWQHVVRKSLSDPNKSCVTKGVTDQDPMCLKRNRDSGKEKQDESNTHSNCDSCPPNKKRVYWTKGLHNKFVDAIEQLGENAVPKEILRIMNEPGMRRENVASHLQKFRKMLKKKNGKVKQEINNDVGPDNKGGHLPNTTILSFGNQGRDATSRHDRAGVHANSNAEMTRLGDGTIKSEPFDTSRMDLKSFFQPPNQQNMFLQHYPPAPQLVNQMTHLGDGTIKSEQFDTSHMDLKSFFQPPNQQNMFLQHYPPAPQLVNQMQPRMHIPVHGNTLQTPLWTGNPPPVPEFNGLKFQTFSSGPKVLNDIMDVPSCFPSYSDGSKPGSSSNPFVLYPPNSYPSGRMFFDYPHQMLGGASTAMTAIPQQNSAVMPVQNSLMGQHGGRNIVDRNGRGNLDLRVQINGSPSGIQGPIIQDSNGNGQINSLQQSQDNSQAGGNFHHNSPICSEDDLSAMVKQFGDDRAPML